VYFLLDTRRKQKFIFRNFEFDYVPFYVGKGKNYRYADHFQYSTLSKENNRKATKIKSIINETNKNPEVVIVYKNLSNEDALKIESDLISELKRIEDGGILTNTTLGGENPPALFGENNGFFKRHHTEESKKIMSLKKLGKKLNKNHIEKLKQSHMGAKNGFFGKKHSKETKLLMSKIKKEKKKKQYILSLTDGKELIVENLKQFCIDNGYTYSCICNLVAKRIKKCYGFISAKIKPPENSQGV
jgi:hypothetical protein